MLTEKKGRHLLYFKKPYQVDDNQTFSNSNFRSPGYPHRWLSKPISTEEKIQWAEFVLKWHQYMSPLKVYMAASIVANNLKSKTRRSPTILEKKSSKLIDELVETATTSTSVPNNSTEENSRQDLVHLLRVN